ncbi:MAG: stage II sporulation protein M [Acidimicrobiia bacterium]
MSLDRFVQERQPRWIELDTLVRRSAGRSRRDPDALRRLGTLYRGAAADLAVARRRFAGDPVVGRLEDLVRRARQVVYSSERRQLSFRYFVTTGYWRRVRERPLLLLASFLLIMGPWVLAGIWAVREPARAAGLVPGGYSSVVNRHKADFGLSGDEKAAVSSEIFTNNIRVAFLAFATGIAAGLGTALVLVYQGVTLGTVFGLTIRAGNGRALFEFVAPHGVLEISCIIVAGAAGMRMGWALVAPGRRRRRDALADEARAAGEIAVGTALVLVLCGIVEGSLSTSGLGLVPAIVVGLVIGGTFWFLVWWRGRPAPGDVVDETDDLGGWEAVRPAVRAATPAPATSR